MSDFILAGLRTLVLCPHTDDEFGCAGTIARLVESGAEMHYVALSRCEASVPQGYPKDVLEKECRACVAELGVPKQNIQVWDFEVRHFPEHRQQILEKFVALNRAIKPQLLLLPSSFDTHQDHATVYQEGFRAFKNCSILGYELPQNTISFENSAFIRLSEENIKKKISCLSLYQSQSLRPYATPEFIRSLATVRGVQSGGQLAEAFEVVRMVL